MGTENKLDLCGGKYTVIYDAGTGNFECLRYGEKWRNLNGDKMVLALFDEVISLTEGIKELEDYAKSKLAEIDTKVEKLIDRRNLLEAENEKFCVSLANKDSRIKELESAYGNLGHTYQEQVAYVANLAAENYVLCQTVKELNDGCMVATLKEQE